MHRFEQEYLNIINEWNSNILLEATLKSLIPNLQKEILGDRSYQDLSDKEKENLQEYINSNLRYIERKVNKLTDNKQYQSWIYNLLKNYEIGIDQTDFNKLKSILIDFEKLCKRPDLKPSQRNIQNYSTLVDLQQFIDNFKIGHKLSKNLYDDLKKIYNNEEFTIYFINKNQYEECNKLFGGEEYFNTGWCIAKNYTYFKEYLTVNNYKDKYDGYFVFIKNNKPFALLHYGSGQFKDISDEVLIDDNPNIIDCLLHINNNIKDYLSNKNNNDLQYYGKQLFIQENPNASKEELIAFEIGGEYIKETNTIDCKGNKVRFKNEWLNEEGTFNFKLINTSNNWTCMFDGCFKLIKLPDNFTIPNNIISCEAMFYHCIRLLRLPDNFTIPNSVTDCDDMFNNYINLRELPDNFTIPDNVKDCSFMFYKCEKLTKLPDNFSIPKYSNYDNIFSHSGMENSMYYKEEYLLK